MVTNHRMTSPRLSVVPPARQFQAGCLTCREREVLAALVQHGTPNVAARSLQISPHTLKIHLTRIYDKLGVGNRTGAIVEAVRRGELSL